jgi:hypothetical protein
MTCCEFPVLCVACNPDIDLEEDNNSGTLTDSDTKRPKESLPFLAKGSEKDQTSTK